MDWLIVNQGRIGLWIFVVGGLYLVAILVPLTARASWRSRLLLGTDSFSKFLSGILFSVPGIVFNLLVLVLVVAAASLWALQPIPRLHDIEPIEAFRVTPGNKQLILYVGGWQGDTDRRLVGSFARDRVFDGVDILVVDYADLLRRREPRLVELAQGLYAPVHAAIADPKYEAVVLIGHSVGGLLARWWGAPEGEGRKPLRVKALLDLAVPKRGADLAALGRALGLPPRLLAEVNDEPGLAAAALRRARDLAPAYCAHGGRDQAVPRDSAFQGCARRDDAAAADHLGIAAPEAPEALTYRRPAELVAEALAR